MKEGSQGRVSLRKTAIWVYLMYRLGLPFEATPLYRLFFTRTSTNRHIYTPSEQVVPYLALLLSSIGAAPFLAPEFHATPSRMPRVRDGGKQIIIHRTPYCPLSLLLPDDHEKGIHLSSHRQKMLHVRPAHFSPIHYFRLKLILPSTEPKGPPYNENTIKLHRGRVV